MSVGVLLLTSCAGQDTDSGAHGPPAAALRAVGAEVGRADVLRWSGSWRTGDGSPGGAASEVRSADVTADLRATDSGDVLGTMTADGHPAQVMLVAGATVFVKADRAVLDTMGVDNPAAHAGRWTEMRGPDGTRGVLGLRLDRLAPSVVGANVASTAASPGGEGGSASPVPSGAAEWFSRPSGVPADAAPVAVAADETTGAGTYWLSADAPHRLLGYSGLDVRQERAGEPVGALSHAAAAKLSVRTEGAPAARKTRTALRSAVRSLPSTVPVSLTPTREQVAETTDEVCGPRCHSVTVTVALTNRLPRESVTARYELDLTAAKRMDGGRILLDALRYESFGSCTVRLPTARPGATVRGSCTFDGAALREAVDESTDDHGFVLLDFRTETTRRLDDVTGPSHAEDLLHQLDSPAAASS
ncbi:hypothetical protein ACFWNK_10035 [Streptomyces sp. NPDC058417]|uniref:hypothetical protein n=1 Tax=unclassified Streptomyces TaxID=2593676 RepID=UPI003647CFE9